MAAGRDNSIDISEVVALPVVGDDNEVAAGSKGMGTSKYHDIECCEWTRGIDTLIERYKQDREELTYLVLNDPDKLVQTIWRAEGPLAIDNECLCQMGRGENRSPFACAQCKNLRRLIDFRLGGVERPFKIECGKDAGKDLIVASSEINMPFINWDEDSARKARVYVQQYHNLTICGTPDINGMRCITGDTFTTRTIILWMIHKLFSERGLPHVPTMHTAFVCRGIGYSLYDMPTIGTLASLHSIDDYHETTPTMRSSQRAAPKVEREYNQGVGREYNQEGLIHLTEVAATAQRDPRSQHLALAPLKCSVARTIIVQLLVTLLELSKVNFSHGTPSIHGLIFTKDPVSYAYDGVHVEGPVTLQISDLWNSSATFNNVHYFPKNVKSSMYLERGMFVPEISTKTVSMAHCHDTGITSFNSEEHDPIACPATVNTCPDANTYSACKPKSTTLYRLTNSTLDIYNAMRHIGFPLYVGSFDFYCFMVSLMCDRSFYDAVTHDDRLYRLWSMMWLIEDLPNVERMIKDAHDAQVIGTNARSDSNTVINIIRGSWLRCDIIKYIWSLIKLGW